MEWAGVALRLVLQVVKRAEDTVGFAVLPRRWAVERTNGWLLRIRRPARDHERTTTAAEAMIYWSMTVLMTRRLAARC